MGFYKHIFYNFIGNLFKRFVNSALRYDVKHDSSAQKQKMNNIINQLFEIYVYFILSESNLLISEKLFSDIHSSHNLLLIVIPSFARIKLSFFIANWALFGTPLKRLLFSLAYVFGLSLVMAPQITLCEYNPATEKQIDELLFGIPVTVQKHPIWETKPSDPEVKMFIGDKQIHDKTEFLKRATVEYNKIYSTIYDQMHGQTDPNSTANIPPVPEIIPPVPEIIPPVPEIIPDYASPTTIQDLIREYYNVTKSIKDSKELTEASLQFIKEALPNTIWATCEEDMKNPGTVPWILTEKLRDIAITTKNPVRKHCCEYLLTTINTYNAIQVLKIPVDPKLIEEVFTATKNHFSVETSIVPEPIYSANNYVSPEALFETYFQFISTISPDNSIEMSFQFVRNSVPYIGNPDLLDTYIKSYLAHINPANESEDTKMIELLACIITEHMYYLQHPSLEEKISLYHTQIARFYERAQNYR